MRYLLRKKMGMRLVIFKEAKYTAGLHLLLRKENLLKRLTFAQIWENIFSMRS